MSTDPLTDKRGEISGLFDLTVDSRFFLAPVAGAGWLTGIWLADILGGNEIIWLALSLLFMTGAIVWWRRGRTGLFLAFFAALSLGGIRYISAAVPMDSGQIHFYNGTQNAMVRGIIAAEPIVTDTQKQLRITVSELATDSVVHPVVGTILVRTNRFSSLAYGDVLLLSGDLAAPSSRSNPDYAAYLERQGVYSVMDFPAVQVVSHGEGSPIYHVLLRVKDRGREAIVNALPEPHAALLTGILLGDDNGMPRELSEDFQTTGMTHIVAISGFNIAVIIGLLDVLTGAIFPRRLAAILIMIALGLYAALVGAGASVVRASIMGITYLIGFRLLGRPTLAVAGLFTAAFLMTLAQPNLVWDVGFQLSFAATLGLMIYAGPWTLWLDRRISAIFAPEVRGRMVRLLGELLVVTVAAHLLTIPLILYHFGRLSLVSLPANLLVLPVQPAIMSTGGLTLLLGFVVPAAAQVTGLVAWLFLNYTIRMIQLLAQIPSASIPLPLSAAGLVIVYLLIAGVTLWISTRKEERSAADGRRRLEPRLISYGVIGVLIGAILFAWYTSLPDRHLHVAFLDVGQGDAIFIQTPNGRQVLVDGGRYPSELLDQLGRQIPFWDRSIDLVVATHPDDDHVAGLVDVMDRYNVGGLITNGADAASDPAFAALLAEATERGVAIHPTRRGEIIKLDEEVQIEILNPVHAQLADDSNSASIVARLTFMDLSVLLTGDIDEDVEMAMLENGQVQRSLILKAGHHGANTSSSSPFLSAVSPEIIIISAGIDNPYGHPHPAMLARAAAVGATVLRTDELGTLEVISDGRQMWWTAENGTVPNPP